MAGSKIPHCRSIWYGPGRAGQLRIPDEPRRRMARHVELGDHADAAIARVRDHLAHLILRVVLAVGAHLLQLRKALALDAEALVIGKVPVEDVQLHGRHAVERALHVRDGIQWRATSSISPRQGKRGWSSMVTAGTPNPPAVQIDQLQEGLHAAHHAQRIGSVQPRAHARSP